MVFCRHAIYTDQHLLSAMGQWLIDFVFSKIMRVQQTRIVPRIFGIWSKFAHMRPRIQNERKRKTIIC